MWHLFLRIFLLGRSPKIWRQKNRTTIFLSNVFILGAISQISLRFDTVLFVMLLTTKLANPDFKAFKDWQRELTEELLKRGSSIPWTSPGFDKTFVSVFSSGAKKLVLERKTIRNRVPLSTSQLFLVCFSVLPHCFCSAGFYQGKPIKNFLSQASLYALLLVLADGIRGGEVCTRVQKKWSEYELKRIPRISNLDFFDFATGKFVSLSDFSSVYTQILFLERFLSNLKSFFVFKIRYTKPGRRRAIVFSHFHIFNSIVMCPICILGGYLTHRIIRLQKFLKKKDFLFIFVNSTNDIVPFTMDILTAALIKICEALEFTKIRIHNFKHGILSELYQAAEEEMVSVSTRFLLHVADHKPDYHQDYLIPDLLHVANKIHYVRTLRLRAFQRLYPREFSTLLRTLHTVLPVAVPDSSS